MSLFKQVLFSFVLLISVILSAVIYLNIQNDKDFIQSQLQSNAQNVATSLSISLINPLQSNDLASASSIIDSIYDSGYYEYIKVYDNNGKIIIDKQKILVVKDVPSWFIELIEFNLVSSKADMSAGWSKIGVVEVKNHTGYAYYKLMETFMSLLKSILLISLFTIVIIYFGLKILLASLAKIENQAIAITKNKFISNDDKPYTLEFMSVIKAMNIMVAKVEDIFKKETEYLSKYNNLLYRDSVVAEVSNRRFFVMKLNGYLGENSNFNGGVFVFFTISNLEHIKETFGFINFKNILSDFSKVLIEIEKSHSNTLLAKLNETDFAMVFPDIQISNIKDELESKILGFGLTLNETYEDLKIHGAIIEFCTQETQKTLLSKTDNLLAKAKQNNNHKIEYSLNSNNLISFGKEEWQTIVKSLNERNDYFKLAVQSVVDVNSSIISSKEVFLRFIFNHEIYSANQIIPIINELKLQDEIDKFVIQSVFDYLIETGFDDKFSININSKFIKYTQNIHWLGELLAKNREFAKNISFEASSSDVITNYDSFSDFVLLIKKYDCDFGMDNFALTNDYDYIRNLQPSYIKIDKTILLDLLNDSSNSGLFNSLNTIIQTLDIQIIVTAVENEMQKQVLKEHKLITMQGRFIMDIELLEI